MIIRIHVLAKEANLFLGGQWAAIAPPFGNYVEFEGGPNEFSFDENRVMWRKEKVIPQERLLHEPRDPRLPPEELPHQKC